MIRVTLSSIVHTFWLAYPSSMRSQKSILVIFQVLVVQIGPIKPHPRRALNHLAYFNEFFVHQNPCMTRTYKKQGKVGTSYN